MRTGVRLLLTLLIGVAADAPGPGRALADPPAAAAPAARRPGVLVILPDQ